MFMLHNKNYPYIVDYHSKFSVIKKMKDLSANRLILTCKIIFCRNWVNKEDNVRFRGNFISDKCKTFCRCLNIEQAFLSSYHHQSNGQMEVCIKFIKQTLKKCLDNKYDQHLALLQIRSTTLGPGLPSPASLLFNHAIGGILPIINRPLIGLNNNNDHHETLIKIQTKMIRTVVLPEYMLLFL